MASTHRLADIRIADTFARGGEASDPDNSCFRIANASVIMAARPAFKFVGDNKVCLSTTIANNALGTVRQFGLAAMGRPRA